MSNLEALTLNIQIQYRRKFVDGVQINNEILVHVPKLRQFSFHIHTEVFQQDVVHQLSEGGIRRTLVDIKDYQVICIVTPIARHAICQVFSIPFVFDRLEYVTHTCPSIIFSHVTFLSVWDVIPFEHQFFLRITRCFPMLKELL